MNFNNVTIKKKIFLHGVNLMGKNIKGKHIIFQSDDWGSERMPSRSVYNSLLKQNWIKIASCPYSKYDSLETSLDIERLTNLLDKHKDHKGNPVNFTLNFNVSNPDFDKISNSNFEDYFYKDISTSYQLKNSHNVFKLIEKGTEEGFFDCQYHGKQHLNPKAYMDLLKDSKSSVRKAFDYDYYALSFQNNSDIKIPYLATYYPFEGYDRIKDCIDGVTIFEKAFKKRPSSFIAPVYIWNKEIEDEILKNGIKGIQGLYFRKDFELNKEGEISYRFNNQVRKDRINMIRNCFFEPSINSTFDWLSNCLYEISVAFMHNQPAVICSHRLNYIGSIFQENSDKNLAMLDLLLKSILKLWPEVNFTSTSDLIKLYEND